MRTKTALGRWFLAAALITGALLMSYGLGGCAKAAGDTGNLHVLVQGAGDGPLAGVKVVSNTQPDGQLKVTGLTGSDGTVTFNGIKAGPYEFYVSGAGYQQQQFSVTVNAGKTRDITITMANVPG